MPDNQENPMNNNPEAPSEWFHETYPDPHTPGDAEAAVQQQLFESTPDYPEQRVVTYLGSLIELGILEGDPEERAQDQPGGQEYDQATEDMNRVTDIETRAREGQELTARDIYFLREYGGTIQIPADDRDLRINQLLQDRDASADLDMMLENFDQFDQLQLAQDMMDGGWHSLLARNLDKFQKGAVDYAQLAWDMMRNGGLADRATLAENLEKFPDDTVHQVLLAWDLLESGPSGQNILAENLDKFLQFEAIDRAERVRELLEFDPRGQNIIAENLEGSCPFILT